MLERVTAGAFFWNPRADKVRWSPKLLATLGYEPSDAAGLLDIEALIHPEDRDRHAEILGESMKTGDSYEVEIRIRNSVDDYQHFFVHGFWLERDGDPIAELTGFLYESTTFVKWRDSAIRSESLFKAFFDMAPAAVYVKDSNSRNVYGNEFAAQIAGCTQEEFIGKRTGELFDDDTAAALAAVDRRILEDGETITRQGEFTAGDGSFHYVLDRSFLIEDPITREKLIGGFGMDITELHRMQLALANSQKMEAMGQLVSGIAHDFNNTLAVLQGNLEIAGLSKDPGEVDVCLGEMGKAVERARRLTTQLLAYGRKAILKPKPTNLNNLVANLDRMIRRTLPEDIDVETALGDGLRTTLIDASEVEDAILNLVLNARDAMPGGGRMKLETANVHVGEHDIEERSGDDTPGEFIMLAVTDTGCGMSEDVAARAFDPFYTTKQTGEGSGMGLAMVYGLMRQTGGSAAIRSELDVGTTVRLYFPASDQEEEAVTTATDAMMGGTEHLLLVEDEPSVRNAHLRQLLKLGYRVSEAQNGDAAFEMIECDPSIDLVMTDIVMPGKLQGPGLARAARDLRPDLPMLFLSGYPRETAFHDEAVGSDDINLTKPVTIAQLAAAIRKTLDDGPTSGS